MKKDAGTIEVDLFSGEVDNTDHPEAVKFKRLLEEVAKENRCRLLTFQIREGTASFSFDSDELTAKILQVLCIGKKGG
jgi:hypothetical protein